MKTTILGAAAITASLAQITLGVPDVNGARLHARQSIDFDLVDSAPDPTVQPDDISASDPAAAIASVIAEVRAGTPLSERKRALEARDIIVGTYPGYTVNVLLGNVAINAPLDCNQKVRTHSAHTPSSDASTNGISGYLHGREAIHGVCI